MLLSFTIFRAPISHPVGTRADRTHISFKVFRYFQQYGSFGVFADPAGYAGILQSLPASISFKTLLVDLIEQEHGFR